MKLTKFKKGLIGLTALGMYTTSAVAAIEGENWWVGGRIKQGFSLAYDLEHNGAELGPSQFVIEVDSSWRPTSSLTVKADFWLRGDWFTDIGGDIIQRGMHDPTTAAFLGGIPYNIRKGGIGLTNFGASSSENRFLSDFNDEMIRELSIKYKDPEGRFSLKVGKFQTGWGESDGLRLLDVVNATDLRERFILGDAVNSRIPVWTMATNLDFRRMGIDKPFKALGLKRTKLELIFMPEVRHTEFVINNPTSGASSGGIFGLPYPRLIDPISGMGMPYLGTNLRDKEVDKFSFNDANFAARLKFETLGGNGTLNFLYGHQDLPLTSLTGSTVYMGTAINDGRVGTPIFLPGGSTTQTLNVAQTEGAGHGPGGYLDFLRSLPTAPGSVAFPLVPFGCNDILAGQAPNCSLSFNFDLDYTFRKKLVGASFTREMVELKLGPKNVSPVLRTEFTYEFDKPFNKYVVNTPFGATPGFSPNFGDGTAGSMGNGNPIVTGQTLGTEAMVISAAESTTKRDQWSMMVGFDYFLWLPFLPDQRGSVFTSVQFFNIHTNNYKNLLFQAPYATSVSLVNKNQKYASFLWNFAVFDQRLFIEGLSVWDISYHAFTHRQRFDFNFFGDIFRPRLEWIHVSGKKEQGLIGLFKNSDIVEMSLTVQF